MPVGEAVKPPREIEEDPVAWTEQDHQRLRSSGLALAAAEVESRKPTRYGVQGGSEIGDIETEAVPIVAVQALVIEGDEV